LAFPPTTAPSQQRKRLVLARTNYAANAVAPVENTGADGVLHPEAPPPRRQATVESQPAGGHLVDAPGVVLRVFVKDVLGRPSA